VRHVSDVQPQTGTRASAGPSLLQSSMSSIPSKTSLNQKKPGGLRAALKRMFSSKKHRSVPTDASNFLYSDPGHLRPTAEEDGRTRLDSAPPFSADFGTRAAALGSHSTNPQQAEEFDQCLPSPPRRGRRNTLPSLVFSDRDSALIAAITARPPTNSVEPEDAVKEDAITDRQFKRRSRSADALNELVCQGGVERPSTKDRAGTIAFWRNSAIENPVPVYSGQSIAVDPSHLRQATSANESQEVTSSMSPMQTFDFGLPSSERDDISLEQRLGTLEIKIFDFEFALAKLQGHNIPNPRLNNTQTPIGGSLSNPYYHNETSLTLTTESSNDLTYLSLSGEEPPPMTFLSSPNESPLPSPQGEADDLFRPQRASKATTATITPVNVRHVSPAPSRASSRSSIHIPAHKFEALLDLVKEEKVARLRLEEQVNQLQKEMDSLRTPIYATIREAYPTPSPESNPNNLGTPRMRTLHRAANFSMSHSLPPEISRFSGTEDSDGEEDDDDEDVYETPKEEQRNTFETARSSPRTVVG
jgi:chemotaxis protein histidine kinase CheA